MSNPIAGRNKAKSSTFQKSAQFLVSQIEASGHKISSDAKIVLNDGAATELDLHNAEKLVAETTGVANSLAIVLKLLIEKHK